MKMRTGTLVKRGKFWHVVWKVDGKQFGRSTKKTTLPEAEKERTRIMAPFRGGDQVEVLQNLVTRLQVAQGDAASVAAAAPGLLLADAWLAYLDAPGRPDSGPGTLRTYEMIFAQFLAWLATAWPDIAQLRHVTEAHAAGYARHLTTKGVSPNTFNKAIRTLRLVFRVLGRQEKLSGTPWDEVQLKRQVAFGRRALSAEELAGIVGTAEGELRTLFEIGLYLGCRLGDACSLSWSAVDLGRGLVAYTPGKTGRPLAVPLHPVLAAALAQTPTEDRKGPVLPEIAARYERDPSGVTRQIQRHIGSCGIVTTEPGKLKARVLVGFHSLRHSAVSMLRDAGAPLSVTMGIVGHTTTAMHDLYTHAGAEAMREAIGRMPDVTGKRKGSI